MTRWDRRVALAERRRSTEREHAPAVSADLPELHADDAATLDLIAASTRSRGDFTTTFVARLADGSAELVPLTVRVRDGNVAVDVGPRLDIEHPVTGLPRERAVEDYLRRALRGCADSSGVAVIAVGIDRFKGLARSRGQEQSEALLRWIARALASRLTPGDLLAHTSGDVFTIVAPKINARHEAFVLAESLRACTLGESDPVVSGVTLSAGCTIGHNTSDPFELMLDAQDALGAAKAAGRNQTRSMDTPLRETVASSATANDRLLAALEDNRIELHFQPVFEVPMNRIVSMEGLLRIDEPGAVASNATELLHLATDSTLLQRLEARLFKLLCQRIADWEAFDRDLRLSLNVNVRLSLHREVWERMIAYIARAGLRPDRFLIEIDSRLIESDVDDAAELINCLRSEGIGTCLDGFSGEPAAFAILERLRPDYVKLDRGFVESVLSDAGASAAAACVETLNGLGLTVVAVGVETPQQLDRLQAIGCRHVQGWLLSPPLAPHVAELLLLEDRHPQP